MLGIPTQLEFAIIGIVILVGVAVDEVVRQIAAQRRRVRGFEVVMPQASGKPPSPPAIPAPAERS
jgi:hypothetical protein